MPALVLALAILNPVAITAYQTWDELSWSYQLPPVSVEAQAPRGYEGMLGTYMGRDSEGRARIWISGRNAAFSTAHEAAHALLDAASIHPDDEERWADGFAFCTVATDVQAPDHIPTCDQVESLFLMFRR